MSGFQCANNSRRALYRVFISSLERHEAWQPRQLLPVLQRAGLPTQSLHRGQSRSFVSAVRRLRDDGFPEPAAAEQKYDPRYTTKESFERSGRDRLPQDHEITDPMINLLIDGQFDGPSQTRAVLRSLKPTESLRMITPYIPARPKDDVQSQYALCKLVNKKEEFQRQQQVQERRKATKAAKTKEIELNWGISDNDLATKMRQLGAFLKKGLKVEMLLGQKKRAKKVDEEAAKDLLKKVKKGIEELEAREWKDQDGNVGRTLRLYLVGKQQQPQQKQQEQQQQEKVQQEE